MNFLFLDTETTGFTDTDEILSLSMVDAAGTVLLNTYIRPVRKRKWPAAMAVNGITPAFIFRGNFPTMETLRPQIQEIVRSYSLVAYNMAFDSKMLRQNGIDLTGVNLHCCMDRFAIWNGEPSTKSYHKTGYRTVKLIEAARIARHDWTGAAHGSLPDTYACRAVWEFLEKNSHPDS